MSEIQLLCLAYSGASAMVYHRWRRRLPAGLRLHPVELPGRGGRIGEPLQTDIATLAPTLAREIHGELRPPYAVFGHSLGALLGYEVIHALQALGAPDPLALCASGTSAPTHRTDRERGYDRPKSDAELIAELRKFAGTPEEVLSSSELLALMLPVLRADFLLCGRYEYRERRRLCCAVHVLGGRDDDVTAEQLAAWRDATAGDFSLDMFDGGHFFVHEQELAVLQTIERHLLADLRDTRRRTAAAAQREPAEAAAGGRAPGPDQSLSA